MLLLWSAPQPLGPTFFTGLKVVPLRGPGLALPDAWAGSMRRGLIGDGPRRPFPKRQWINRRGRVVWIRISCRTKPSASAHSIVGFLVFILDATTVIDIDADTHRHGHANTRVEACTMEEERTITLDLGSSPDPLIDPVLSPPMMPPSHIKKKSQASERLFTALAPLSPRKQTFELDVGDERSPQRLRVTVEADDDGTRNTSRRLFQSPTPKRRATPRKAMAATTTTITTVPLRGLSDDEGPATGTATPRRRGRPRKSGTPIPTTTTHKRPGTPARGRKPGVRASLSPEKDILTSDIGFDTTPRPTVKVRKPVKRKASSPAKEDGAPGSQPRKRGRPRKQTITADEIDAHLERVNTGELIAQAQGGGSPAPAQIDVHPAISPSVDDRDDDIWLATMSDELPSRDQRAESEPQLPRQEPAYQQHDYDWPDMGGGADSYSEAGSLASELHDGDDTIMAGEEFTMISIGSLPSMQPNSSIMAPAHEELGEATSLIIDGALEFLRQSQNRHAEGVASPQQALTVAKAQTGPAEAPEDSVEQHGEPRLLPPTSPQTRRRSPRRTTAHPLARQLAEKSLQQRDAHSPAPPQPPAVVAEPHEASAYDDSFSEIPEAVLGAATPRRPRQAQPPGDEAVDEDIQPSIERPSRVNQSNPQSETNRLLTPDETPSPLQSENENHDSVSKPPRAAPDVDLPSSPPIESPPQQSDAYMPLHIRRNSTETPADQLSSFTSSNGGVRDTQSVHLPVPDPQPRPTLSPIVRAGRALQHITSDPPSPPGRDSVLGSPFRGSVPKSSQSPAPFIGRVTQPLSQPRGDVLAQSPQRSWLAPLSQMRDFIVRSAQSLSPARVSVSGADPTDDPFGPDPGESSGTMRSTLFSGPKRHNYDQKATASVASSTGAGGGHGGKDEDEMSWQAEGSPAGASDRSADMGNLGSREQTGAARGWSTNEEWLHRQSESLMVPLATRTQTNLSKYLEDYEEQEEASYEEQQQDLVGEGEQNVQAHEEEQEEEDEDIWAFEAQRPTPYASRNVRPRQQEPVLEPPRRGKIPSPWRQNSRGLVYSDELEQQSDQNDVANEDEEPRIGSRIQKEQVPVRFGRDEPRNEEEEFSMLSHNRQRQAPAASNLPATKKPDLSAFFSSPAMLPDMDQGVGAGLPKTFGTRQPQQTNPFESRPRAMPAQRPQPSNNGLFAQYLDQQTQAPTSSVPLRRLEIGKGGQRKVDLFSPARKSVEQSSPERAATPILISSSPQSSVEARPAHIPQDIGFAPRQQQSEGHGRVSATVPRPVTPESPEEEAQPAHIPQKMNFTPRRRDSNSTLFQARPAALTDSLFNNSQVSNFFASSRPQSQRPGGRSREEEESSSAPPPLKPVPDRAVSPGKSCIRSPLKPKTPGRVVEFTSSTLSPLAQAQARAERRASMSPEKDTSTATTTNNNRPQPVRSNLATEQQEQEEDHNTEPPSSPSLSPQLPPLPRFSTTIPTTVTTTTTRSNSRPPTKATTRTNRWTKSHWLRLDALLQARKLGALAFQLQHPSTPSVGHDCRHLLGKHVTAQGETMTLERWHLDVVEAFLSQEHASGEGDVGGGAAQIAKRVFALLVGEERRRLGLVPGRNRDRDER